MSCNFEGPAAGGGLLCRVTPRVELRHEGFYICFSIHVYWKEPMRLALRDPADAVTPAVNVQVSCEEQLLPFLSSVV